MIRIDALDVRRRALDPARYRASRARARAYAGAALATGLVGELPRKNGGLVLVPADEGTDVGLVGGLHVRVGIEHIVVEGAGNLLGVDVHAAIVTPVICAMPRFSSTLLC